MKNKIKIINRDQLKYIAALLIFIGHFMTYTISELHFFGLPSIVSKILVWIMYAAPPVFMFFISEGFCYTRNRAKYAVRLLLSGIATQFAFVLANTGSMDWDMFLHMGNVILTLLLSLIILIIYDSKLNVFLKIFLGIVCVGGTYLWNMEWAVIGPLMVFALYMLRDKPGWRFAAYEILMMGYVVITMGGRMALVRNIGFLIVVQIPIILITFFYNGRKGRFPKFSRDFFYFFYPAHLFFIFLVKIIIR